MNIAEVKKYIDDVSAEFMAKKETVREISACISQIDVNLCILSAIHRCLVDRREELARARDELFVADKEKK